MEATKELKELLFEELELIVRTTAGLVRKISPQDWEFKPRENMRTIRELVSHLVAIPAVDLLILQENSQDDVRALEATFDQEHDPEVLLDRMQQGLRDLRAYMENLSEEDFLHKKTTPFYLPDHGVAQAKWLIEITTHAQHHRGQLFTYLKTLGYEINMFDLY